MKRNSVNTPRMSIDRWNVLCTYMYLYVRFSRIWMILVLRWVAIAISADATKIGHEHEGQKTIRTNERQFETCYTDATWMHATIIDWTEKGTKKSADAFRKLFLCILFEGKKKRKENKEREKRKREKKKERESQMCLTDLSKNNIDSIGNREYLLLSKCIVRF